MKEPLCGFKSQVTAGPTPILQGLASLSDLAGFYVAGGWESSQGLYIISRVRVLSVALSYPVCPFPFLGEQSR